MTPPRAPHDRSPESAPSEEADAREFDDYAAGMDQLDIEAATWVARRRRGLDAVEETELRDWLAADPAHGKALHEMEETFGRVRGLSADDVASLRASLPESPGARFAPPCSAARVSFWRKYLPDPRRFMPQVAMALVVLALVGGGWFGWDYRQRQPIFEKTYISERGQRMKVELPDGSQLLLDAATRAETRLYRGRREVKLLDGQIMFSVHADPKQPFDVLAGALRVTVVGTRFSVRHTQAGLEPRDTRVEVEEGRVRVSRADAADGTGGGAVELTADQGVSADPSGLLGPVRALPAGSVAPWREGRVNFDNTPLAQVLAELDRYGGTGLVFRDPAVGSLRVGGSFDLQHLDSFTRALPQLLPVRLVPRNGVTVIEKAD